MNQSGMQPVGHRILVLPDPVEEVTASGIVLARESTERDRMKQTYGVVVAMGNTAYADVASPWCKIGDHVMFGRYTGHLHTGIDGKEYRILNDLDIAGIVLEK